MIFSRSFITGAALLLPLFSCFILTGCQKNESTKASALTPLESRGKAVYLTNCIACHNPDPRIDGSIGPAVAFSSLALLEARVLTRSYPPGYTPKRKSEMMPDFPQLKDDIPGLHAYLNSFKK
jgi:mono/diheme cytochrome c family protein